MKNFTIVGVAGYVAPRHLKAIKDTENSLLCAFDPHDSVGALDNYFPSAEYFYEYERFERHISKLSLKNELDFMTVCSPNYLHDTHIRLALNNNLNVICEKPLVLSPKNLDALEKIEMKGDKKIYSVMQLRNHPSLMKLKDEIRKKSKRYSVKLDYITSRGNWYFHSWKGDEKKSGGIATNIGIHLFDLLIWFFGSVDKYELNESSAKKMKGKLILKNADVEWFLSIDQNDLPKWVTEKGRTTYRSIKIDNNEVEFSEGFSDLHTKVYQEIFEGNGLRISDARPSIELVYNLRQIKL